MALSEGIEGAEAQRVTDLQTWRLGDEQGLAVSRFKSDDSLYRVEIAGSAAERLGLQGVSDLLRQLDRGFRWHFTRVDAAADGFRVSPRDVYDHAQLGEVRDAAGRPTGAFSSGIVTRSEVFSELKARPSGLTCYFVGAKGRGSERLFRIYDSRGFTRLEAEFKGKRAREIGPYLLQLPPSEWGEFFASLMLGFIDFVEHGERPTRAARLPWWAEFVQAAVKVRRLEGSDAEASQADYDRACRRLGYWAMIRKPVAKLVDALGMPWLLEQLDDARRDYSDADRADVEVMRRARGTLSRHRIAGVHPWPAESRDEDSIPF